MTENEKKEDEKRKERNYLFIGLFALKLFDEKIMIKNKFLENVFSTLFTDAYVGDGGGISTTLTHACDRWSEYTFNNKKVSDIINNVYVSDRKLDFDKNLMDDYTKYKCENPDEILELAKSVLPQLSKLQEKQNKLKTTYL